jgi:hypothetical protein
MSEEEMKGEGETRKGKGRGNWLVVLSTAQQKLKLISH